MDDLRLIAHLRAKHRDQALRRIRLFRCPMGWGNRLPFASYRN